MRYLSKYNYIQSLYLCFVFSYFDIYFEFVEHAYYANSSYCFTIHSPLPFTMMAAIDSDGCLCSNVKIGSGNGLVPQGDKPLPEPIGSKMFAANGVTGGGGWGWGKGIIWIVANFHCIYSYQGWRMAYILCEYLPFYHLIIVRRQYISIVIFSTD